MKMNFNKQTGFKILGVFLGIFGMLTIKSGSAVLFFDSVAREAAGNYVPFVLWSNFIAGFFYVIAGVGIFLDSKWSTKLAVAIAFFTIGLFIAFGIHIAGGGLYETRTVGAMLLRTTVWIVGSVLLLKFNQKNKN